ncbi:MAG: hypothetical protein A2275_12480 [Bacteroidetes bacterium RIFOXYA12_FULL_35_11]|nr:MAG: hypothetical protein A2X01_02535 [Bacteroidetes bacterium GWF2_35_48]OFY77894.1 MAG: hypothetical protein A2275_12480 [Bacteroidetes bacterium RIFOXYA12_FULL_35_11]OFY95121.1 MAG: hypothetical protein A2309_04410 [Bacteroidetes bacterium RIFOXYB2_FULL_35_7]OFY96039.1 MAG: hypothetical protein A2491_06085 [Bacteroidetes bacterium RIFOXYC12_FULL_35_7]HBX50366.1 hypothetical protein [Bacteroidales bacterium]
MKNLLIIILVFELVFSINELKAQQVNNKIYSEICDCWNCLMNNKNKEAIIKGVFRKYTPNKIGKGANQMFWDWEIQLSDGYSVPIKNTYSEINYSSFENKFVQIKGLIFFGTIIGSGKEQSASGYRIDPIEIVEINNYDFQKILKQIQDSLPDSWTALTDLANVNEIVIQSTTIDLKPDLTTSDPQELKGKCEIFILRVPRISPDSIEIKRKLNKKLRDNLPPQISKDNLKIWYIQNEKSLKLLDEEPTNYDNNYSYRIKCRRFPKNDEDRKTYNRILSFLNRHFISY